MTFCLGIEVEEGVVAVADTRIVRGAEHVNKQKIGTVLHGGHTLFTMTSGLRAVRDKTHFYVEEALEHQPKDMTRLWQFANLFGQQLRRVREEDAPSLEATGHSFNLHAIIGGRLEEDERPGLIYVYPEGNWVTAAEDSNYFIIGRTYYGRPILDRLLHYDTPLRSAAVLGVLAFDATSTSVTDVGLPIDVAVLPKNSTTPQFSRLAQPQLGETINAWNDQLQRVVGDLPGDWVDGLTPGG